MAWLVLHPVWRRVIAIGLLVLLAGAVAAVFAVPTRIPLYGVGTVFFAVMLVMAIVEDLDRLLVVAFAAWTVAEGTYLLGELVEVPGEVLLLGPVAMVVACVVTVVHWRRSRER